MKQSSSSNSKPTNKKLYDDIVKEAKKKFKVYPSVYASSWLVKEYKRRGGKYKGSRSKSKGLTRWYREEWIDVCQLPKIVSCGRRKLSMSKWKQKYPYCRPIKQITRKTPVIVNKISYEEIKKRCRSKRRSPLKYQKSHRRRL